MPPIAYALRAAFTDTVDVNGEDVPRFMGGTINLGERELDVFDALAKGNGTIVIRDEDQAAVIALDEYPALKRVPVPDDAPVESLYKDVNVPNLRDELEARGLPTDGLRADLVARLEAHDAGTFKTAEQTEHGRIYDSQAAETTEVRPAPHPDHDDAGDDAGDPETSA